MSQRPLSGRVALVTGANHGIGAATAVQLAHLGADVFITYLALHGEGQPEAYAKARASGANEVVAQCETNGVRAIAIEADLIDPKTPALLFDRAETRLGSVDILINNASGWRKDTFRAAGPDRKNRPTERVSVATIDSQLLVDGRATGLLIGEFAARLMERGADWGRIVSLTSGGPMGFPGEVSYGAAKAALENFTMSAALELADIGVTANVVHPPVTNTGWVTPEIEAFVVRETNRTHIAQPGEIAEVIGWLCTEAARLVNGNIIRLR
ncbi:MAG: SDR family NAD(P)-dependent oxidoreductase [Chthoniobacterales bacterium]|nr:SDR family NAD(P)-dependent oxidoreductase [Chthoniobacterales bacterium]